MWTNCHITVALLQNNKQCLSHDHQSVGEKGRLSRIIFGDRFKVKNGKHHETTTALSEVTVYARPSGASVVYSG